MDRIDAMTVFVATVDAGGFSAAARRLGRSPASITRAVAFLEERAGVALLHRTTRTMKLTEAGERYLAASRRILDEIAEAEQIGAREQAAPRGLLTVTAPLAFGRIHLRPIVDAFLDAHRETRVRLLLLDRVVSLIDEGIDVAVRIAHMPDSSLVATKVGEVRRVLCASPDYLARRVAPREPSELSNHAIISFSQVSPIDQWTFGAPGSKPRHVKIRPRLTVNSAEAAIGSALDGHGITSVLSYQVEREIGEGRLVRLLRPFEPEAVPVHVVYAAASAAGVKVRAFVDMAVAGLRASLSTMPSASNRAPKVRVERRG